MPGGGAGPEALEASPRSGVAVMLGEVSGNAQSEESWNKQRRQFNPRSRWSLQPPTIVPKGGREREFGKANRRPQQGPPAWPSLRPPTLSAHIANSSRGTRLTPHTSLPTLWTVQWAIEQVSPRFLCRIPRGPLLVPRRTRALSPSGSDLVLHRARDL